ncbi:MAG TPA: hypothetical protein VJ739_13660 [Gemmataceae bacterium]|nr:hypothetical protein [Gemmataceae bacterium]
MFRLPPSVACYFQDPWGNIDHRALLNASDEDLLTIGRRMPPEERAELYWTLRDLRVTWVERMMARSLGVDIEAQRYRLLCLLEQADTEAACPPAEEAAPQLAPGMLT